jgi:NTE family protein
MAVLHVAQARKWGVFMAVMEARTGLDALSDLAARLAAVPLFAGMEKSALEALVVDLEWASFPGGAVVYAEGEAPDALYVVLSGLLGIVRGPLSRHSDTFFDVRPGECVGQVGLLTGRPHTGSAIALRDSTICRIDKAAFDRLITMHPPALLRMATEIVEWNFRPSNRSRAPSARRTVALLPIGNESVDRLAESLRAELERNGHRTAILRSSDVGRIAEEYAAIEFAHHVTVYCGDVTPSNWSLLCLRRADRVLFVADGAAEPQRPELVSVLETLPWRRLVLLLMQDAKLEIPAPAARWLATIPAQFHRHYRRGHAGDIARLARYITDRGVGLVLSGGGARAYGHIGVVRALREFGVEFDLLGGTSMGAIIAAGLAHEWSDHELTERMLDAFVRTDPLNDVTLPMIALTRGRKVTARLKTHFGDHRIEDLWRPFFTVSSNLTTSRLQIHRSGLLWRALRASVAIPGLLPPVIENGEVMVDGAVMNNLPAEVMNDWNHGPVIGVDVGRRENFRAVSRGPIARLFLGEDANAPDIAALLLRAGTIGSEVETLSSRTHVDLLIEPTLENVTIRDWKAFDRAVDTGYRYARERLAGADLSRFRVSTN